MMKTIQSRFGEIEYDPENALLFPEGLIGFEELRQFIVMPNKKEGPLFWIQSVEDPQVAFVLTDPSKFFLDYSVEPDEAERRKLGIDEKGECLVISVVTVPPSQKITFNLARKPTGRSKSSWRERITVPRRRYRRLIVKFQISFSGQ